MGVKLQSSSGGSVEIAAPVTASNYVLTAPAKTATLLTTASTGTVLQVVNGTTTTQVSTSSTSFVSSGLSASITPSSSANKILILVSTPIGRNTGTLNGGVNLAIYKNGVSLNSWLVPFAWDNTNVSSRQSFAVNYLDAPASVSAVTYTLYFAANDAAAQAFVPQSGQLATITLMEIAG